MIAGPVHRAARRARRKISARLAVASILTLAFAASARAQAPGNRGVVGGTVRDSSGGALAGAEVRLDGSALRTTTDATGRFRIREVPAGAAQLTVRRLGFRPAALDVDVRTGEETHLDVALVAVAFQLAPVTVSERRQVFDSRLAGFNARREKKRSGYFITRETIDASRLIRFTDLMRTVPGVRVTSTAGIGTRTVRLRGSTCPPLVWVDGFPATAGEFDLDMVDPSSVEGIEVYGGSTSVPVELIGPRGLERCGVIAIWSRPSRPRTVADQEVEKGRPKTSLADQVASRSVYTADRVDEPALLDARTGIPEYPDSLWQRRISGRAVLEFVVDTSGSVEMGTVGTVSSTHPAFAAAGRAALESAHFRPAVLKGQRVRQIVQLPFEFDPARVRQVLPDSTFGRGQPPEDR